MLFTELLNKQVLNINTAQTMGKIIGLTTDNLNIIGLLLDDGIVLSIDFIHNVGDIVTMKECKHIDSDKLLPPIGCQLITTDGYFVGNIVDYFINKQNKLSKLIVDTSEISADKIKSYTNTLIIVKGKKSLNSAKQPLTDSANAMTAQFIPDTSQNHVDCDEEEILESDYDITAPRYDNDGNIKTTIICNYEFLVGRKVLKDIQNKLGILIIKENCIINKRLIELAQQEGKLVELAIYSKI